LPPPRTNGDESVGRIRGLDRPGIAERDRMVRGRMVAKNDAGISAGAAPKPFVKATASDAGSPQPFVKSAAPDAGSPQRAPGTFVVPLVSGPSESSVEVTKDGKQLKSVFDPDKSTMVNKCSRIVHSQIVRIEVDDIIVRPDEYKPWANRYLVPFVVKGGWYLDGVDGLTPDYQQNKSVFGSAGKKLSKSEGGSAKAILTDTPNIDEGPGRQSKWQGFWTESNPLGCKKVVFRFETFPWCMEGLDCSKLYEGGVKWTLTKTWEDASKDRQGTVAIQENNVAKPSEQFLAALYKFNSIKMFTPCKGKDLPMKGERTGS